ncbi:hypothetical protein E5991_06905 [Bifidobacterium pseudolongum]|uniref:Uncharacterized protein n=1 Tax=Bifidobacterium pseudolongum TaxID=1694 RepID=A0A4S4F706_9BIFI|nr:hypothetical protein [Bifidobacterium pseudolongum]THG24924.1 hypothetical protein E5991_06905 [Bifidobacterium pseudolongum]
MKYEVLPPNADLRPGDLCLFVYTSKTGSVKYKSGRFATYTVPERDGSGRLAVLADGRIPQWDGYQLVVAVRPCAEFEDVPILGEAGEILRE